MKSLTQKIRGLVRQTGFDVVRYQPRTHQKARRKALFAAYGITLVFDVGANIGVFGEELREQGYTGKIISFEPVGHCFDLLKARAAQDGNWQAHNFALGNSNSTAEINLAEDSTKSSFLPMDPFLNKQIPQAGFVGKQTIQIKTLDSIFDSLCQPGDNILLKMDVQGFEANVIEGAAQSLRKINTVQTEMSMRSVYTGQKLYYELSTLLYQQGYVLVGFEDGFADDITGQLFEADGLFHRYKQD